MVMTHKLMEDIIIHSVVRLQLMESELNPEVSVNSLLRPPEVLLL